MLIRRVLKITFTEFKRVRKIGPKRSGVFNTDLFEFYELEICSADPSEA